MRSILIPHIDYFQLQTVNDKYRSNRYRIVLAKNKCYLSFDALDLGFIIPFYKFQDQSQKIIESVV